MTNNNNSSMTIQTRQKISAVLLLNLCSSLSWGNTPTDTGVLYRIPLWIEASPTLFPEQSNHPVVPRIEDTAERSWVDQKHWSMRDWVDQKAHQIDDWFGDTNPEDPASATLRILIDQRWDKHYGYEVRPRLRGKIELPTLEKRWSIVFGDDSLDNQLSNQVNISNEHGLLDDKSFDSSQTRDENSSLALRFSDWGKQVPFDTDIDVGIRSGDDLYVRLKAEKDWQLAHDFELHLEQIYRYGIDSEHYLRTNVEFLHQAPDRARISNQFSLIHANASQDDLNWSNHLFRQHHFFQGNRLNYGVYSGGFYAQDKLRLNQWGPFVSWRQPLLREWFYVQADLNYYNRHRDGYSHYLHGLLRLEVLF